MRIAILDLGTNTFNLVIAEKNRQDVPVFIYKKELPVEIGKGGIHKGYIKPEAIQRAVKALQLHQKTIAEYGVENMYAFATSAVRDASNGKEFAEIIHKETGISVKILTGEEEAEWIYKGVQYAGILSPKTSLIMDIGGGSTEFIIADKHTIFWKKSYRLGVTRLYEMFFPADPMTKAKQQEVEQHIATALTDLFLAADIHKPVELIGSSGSFDSFAQMILCRNSLHKELCNGFLFPMKEFNQLYLSLLDSTLAERLTMEGLIAMRAPMLVYAAILTKLVLNRLAIEQMVLSHYALKEGMAGYLLTYADLL